jgi:chromosome segregation protein
MYLKRLEIQGFKSFANKTVLDFLAPKNGKNSVTAVVGPNGSGKSNVVDAIRWVMGEQSVKMLRGKKSEDVIFGGSDAKSSLGACEVSLFLDNSDNRVEVDLPEIVVTRRIYRSGEGEYLINNNPVRLLDIHLLLAKAQFGQHSYSIIGQGTIDRMLIVTPAERKDFLDEASGIKEFQIKQHHASLKLARTSENINQAKMLMSEVEPRLRLLAKQARKLEQRQEIEIKLKEAQEKYYCSLYLFNKKESEKFEQNLKEIEAQYRFVFSELEKVQNELSELAKSESRQEVFVGLQKKYQNIIKEKNEFERQIAVLSGKMQSAYSNAGKQNISWIEKKMSEIKEKAKEYGDARVEVEKEFKKIKDLLLKKTTELESFSREKTQLAVKLSQLRAKQFEQKSERQYLEITGLTAVKAVLENREKIGKVYGIVSELADAEGDYRVALEVAAGQHLASVVAHDESVARKAIEFLRANKSGVATFLPLNKITEREVSDDIKSIISEDGVYGLAIDLIKFDEKFRNIFSFVFGDTLIVKNLSVAERIGIGRARMVTLDGDVAERRGVMKGGWRGQRKMHLSFAGRAVFSDGANSASYQDEIIQSEEILREIEQKIEKIKLEMFKFEAESIALDEKLSSINTENNKTSSELNELERELSFIKMSPEEYTEHLSGLSKEKQLLAQYVCDKDAEAQKIELDIAKFNENEENKKQKVFSLQDLMQKKQLEANVILDKRNELKIQIAKIDTKNEDLFIEANNEIDSSLVSVVDRLNTELTSDELNDTASQIQKLKYQISLIGGIDEDVSKEYEVTKERHEFLSSQLKDLEKATGDLSKMIEELDEVMKKKRSSAFKQIKKEFDRYFKILFNGGGASLEEIYGEKENEETEYPQDDLEETQKVEFNKKEKILTGIDIVANPPGKKIKNINALSGGERTLTSIALICAILNCNPSPFVVMDEVEAALDENNTMRFVDIMSELAQKSQFIIITHNRVTMHAADVLYGVAMGGDGVSKLLSIKIDEAKKYTDIDKK